MNKENIPGASSASNCADQGSKTDGEYPDAGKPEHCDNVPKSNEGQSEQNVNRLEISLDQIQVIFSAPIRIKAFLDLEKLLINYASISDKIHQELIKSNLYICWKKDEHIDKGNHGLIGPDRAGLTNIPPYFLGYYIDSKKMDCRSEFTNIKDDIIKALNKEIKERFKCEEFFTSDSILLRKVNIKFYQFGFASVSIYATIQVDKKYFCDKSKIEKIKTAIESDYIKKIIECFARKYISAYISVIPKKYFDKSEKVDKSYKKLVQENDAYWTHRIISFEFSAKDKTAFEPIDKNCDCLNIFHNNVKTFLTQPVTVRDNNVEDNSEITFYNLLLKKQIFIPGTGNSILYTNSSADKHYKKVISVGDMIEVAGTYSAFMHHYHSKLLYFVNEVIAISEAEKEKLRNIFKLKSKFSRMFDRILKKLYDHSRMNDLFQEYEHWYLSAIAKGAYESTKKEWKTDELWASIGNYIDNLGKIYDKNDNYIDRRNQKIFTILLLVFALGSAGLVRIELFDVKLFNTEIESYGDLFTLFGVIALLYIGYRLAKVLCQLICKYFWKKYSKECNKCDHNCNCVRNCE